MTYRTDTDLEFLAHLSNQQLNDLVDCLTKDKNGDLLLTEELTQTEIYKKHTPHHTKYWQEIAAEIQCFGANSLVTIIRGGKGVLYREVLEDVSDKYGLKIEKEDTIIELEDKLLIKILGDALNKMSEVDRIEFGKFIGLTNLKTFTPASFTAALQMAFKAGGFTSYRLTLVIANAISRAILGRGLALAGNAALMRTASVLAGPVGWALTGAWTIVDLAGPAYRITMPAVIQVALLRKRYEAELDGTWKDIEEELSK